VFAQCRDLQPLAVNFLLEHDQAVQEGLRGRWATWNINIDRMYLSTPETTLYPSLKGPPPVAHAPIAITYFGSGIWSYSRAIIGIIVLVTVPETIIKSACRGDPGRPRRRTGQCQTGLMRADHLDGTARQPEAQRPERRAPPQL